MRFRSRPDPDGLRLRVPLPICAGGGGRNDWSKSRDCRRPSFPECLFRFRQFHQVGPEIDHGLRSMLRALYEFQVLLDATVQNRDRAAEKPEQILGNSEKLPEFRRIFPLHEGVVIDLVVAGHYRIEILTVRLHAGHRDFPVGGHRPIVDFRASIF